MTSEEIDVQFLWLYQSQEVHVE